MDEIGIVLIFNNHLQIEEIVRKILFWKQIIVSHDINNCWLILMISLLDFRKLKVKRETFKYLIIGLSTFACWSRCFSFIRVSIYDISEWNLFKVKPEQ